MSDSNARDDLRITGGDSSKSCLDAGWNCYIDPTTGACADCGQVEDA